MTTQEREPILVTLGDKTTPFSADVLLHYYHIDGSRTILLKTSPRKSVSDFITSELTATENHEHLFISNETEVPPRNATEDQLLNSNRSHPLFHKAYSIAMICHEISNKGKGVFAIHNQNGGGKLYFRRALWKNNGVWKTCLKGSYNEFILNE